MSILEDIKSKLKRMFSGESFESGAQFLQWKHLNLRRTHCYLCEFNHLRIFENDQTKPPIGKDNHLFCECFYDDVEQKSVGSISNKGLQSPDVYLKTYGKLPDYYITTEEAIEKYGWNPRRNTIAGKCPGKMIGGDVFDNREHILPEKEGRIWYECDVDYESGRRNMKRLYYSNDGLMFYTETHNEREVIQIK